MIHITLHQVLSLLPRHKKVSDYFEAPCPAHSGKNFNLHFGDRGDGVWFKCHSRGCSYWDIVKAIGITDEPVPAPPITNAVETHEVKRYVLTMPSGDVVEHVRYESDDGQSKEFKWFCNGEIGLKGIKVADLPLYNVDAIEPNKPVVVVEGEKACDALASTGLIATVATVGGANVAPSEESLRPLLQASEIFLWPDADTQGRNHMADLKKKCLVVGHKKVSYIVWEGAPSKGDAADALELGIDAVKEILSRNDHTSYVKNALGLRDTSEWIDEPEVPLTYVVEGLIGDGLFTMLSGFPKAGKSTFARQLAVSVAKGEPFLGHTTRHGLVLYMALEEAASMVESDLRALGLTSNDQFKLTTQPPNANFLGLIEEAVERYEPALIILDTLTRLPRGNFEMNNYQANAEWLQPVANLAHGTNTAILGLYHMGKSGRANEGYEAHASVIGSTGLSATYDNLIYLTVTSDGTRSFGLQGRSESLPPSLLGFDRDTRTLTLLGTKEEFQLHTDREKVIEAIEAADTEWVSGDYVRKNSEIQIKRVKDVLKQLVNEGKLDMRGKGKSGSPFEYRYAESPFSFPTLLTETRNDMPTEEDAWPVTMTF
jgi:5S rRNA maturation endonuclease (ribonuclease M5)